MTLGTIFVQSAHHSPVCVYVHIYIARVLWPAPSRCGHEHPEPAVRQHKAYVAVCRQSSWTKNKLWAQIGQYQLAWADWEHCAPAVHLKPNESMHGHMHAPSCGMQDRLYCSDVAGCVIAASNAMTRGWWWPLHPPPLVLQFVISYPTTVTGDRLMIVPLGWLGQIGWAAARLCCKWASNHSTALMVAAGDVSLSLQHIPVIQRDYSSAFRIKVCPGGTCWKAEWC